MRLDSFLVEKLYFETRTKAKQAVERGEIFINGKCVLKPSFSVDQDAKIKRVFKSEYVSNGGFKMEKALNDFNFSVNGLICADVGASTGGFTDCLLQNGAKKIYAVDLNSDLLHYKLKENSSVKQVVCNAKNLSLTTFDEALDLVVADLSFISATMIMPVFSRILSDDKFLILLVKPQFEIGEKRKFKNGIVNDAKSRKSACLNVLSSAKNFGFALIDFTTAPINEGKNIEYLLLLQKNKNDVFDINTFNFS